MNQWFRKDAVLPELRENIRSVFEEDTDAKLAEIDVEVKQKQTELLDAGKNQSKIDELAEKTGTSPSYVNRLIKSPEKIINKTFVQMLEQLGYDIELTYIKK